jgi:methyl-accepting chemotaxis protein
VDDLVQSIQFHDITRQQIEHVAQALRHLRLQGAGRRRHSAALPPEARVILTLQSSQLSGAAQTFASSIERMERDLEGIAGRAEEMTVASKELMGLSAGEQDSFFGQMEGHCTTILKMVGSCGEAETEMQCMAARLRETIGRIRESVDEIRAIEIRIQRIATNATIRAAHIGVEGSALDVIAGVMRQAALDSNANTEDVAGALDTMTGAADRVSGVSLISGQTLAGADSGANEAADQIRHTVLELHTSSESSFSRMNQVATLSARLAGEIGTLRGGFSAGGIFADVVGRARAELERIGLESVRDAADGELETAPQLESLAQHYTMQTEREVHESVARGPAIAAAVSSELASGASENGVLGDNVEFF